MTPRILVVGGGYVGLYAALRLQRTLRSGEATVTVVDPRSYMTYQPFLPEAGAGSIQPRHTVVPLRQTLRSTDVVTGWVDRIEHARKVAWVRPLAGEEYEIPYDVLVMAVGSVPRTLPIPGLADWATGFKNVEEAIRLRNKGLEALDIAEGATDPEVRERALTFVFVGGGFAGVEAMAELEDLLRYATRYLHRVRPSDLRFVLVEASDRILPEVGEEMGRWTVEALRERGIEVRLGTRLESTVGGVVQLSDGTTMLSDTVVWTAGVKASPLADVLARHLGDGTLTRGGRVVVTPELTVPGHPEIAVVGDLAASPDGSGGVLPQLAPVAIQGGRLVAANLVAELAGHPAEPFHYVDKGTMATVGRRNAVAQLPGRLRFSGTPGWLAWLGLHLIMLIGFRNRANVMVNWAWNYVTYDRASRLIVGDDDHPARPSGRPMPTDPDR